MKVNLDQLVKKANSAQSPVNLHHDKEFEALYHQISYYLEKYRSSIKEKEDSGEASLLKHSYLYQSTPTVLNYGYTLPY